MYLVSVKRSHNFKTRSKIVTAKVKTSGIDVRTITTSVMFQLSVVLSCDFSPINKSDVNFVVVFDFMAGLMPSVLFSS